MRNRRKKERHTVTKKERLIKYYRHIFKKKFKKDRIEAKEREMQKRKRGRDRERERVG